MSKQPCPVSDPTCIFGPSCGQVNSPASAARTAYTPEDKASVPAMVDPRLLVHLHAAAAHLAALRYDRSDPAVRQDSSLPLEVRPCLLLVAYLPYLPSRPQVARLRPCERVSAIRQRKAESESPNAQCRTDMPSIPSIERGQRRLPRISEGLRVNGLRSRLWAGS
jgi:hypothetical protein